MPDEEIFSAALIKASRAFYQVHQVNSETFKLLVKDYPNRPESVLFVTLILMTLTPKIRWCWSRTLEIYLGTETLVPITSAIKSITAKKRVLMKPNRMMSLLATELWTQCSIQLHVLKTPCLTLEQMTRWLLIPVMKLFPETGFCWTPLRSWSLN